MSAPLDEFSPVFAIAVAAELAGMHPQTLRQYDRLGLVSPTRTAGQSRRYSMRDVAQLREIATIHPDWMVIAHCEVKLPDRGPGLCDRLPAWAPRAGDVVVADPVQLAAVIG